MEKINSLYKKNFSKIICAALFIAALTACSSSEPITDNQSQIEDIPEWYTSPPQDNEEYLYGVGNANSTRLNIARQRAEIDAKSNLAAKLGQKIEDLQKLFEEEIDSDQVSSYSGAFTNATQLITSQELRGVSTQEQKFSPTEDGNYVAYVWLQMPVGEARDQLEKALSRDEEMYIRFKESKAFEELQNNLNRLGLDGEED